MKLLIDECLSEELTKLAQNRGHPDASHVRWIRQGRHQGPGTDAGYSRGRLDLGYQRLRRFSWPRRRAGNWR